MKTLTWLHISDLHLRPCDNYNQHRVLNPLLKELERRRQEGWRFDAIFCTGDIAYSGGGFRFDSERYPEYEQATAFFDQVLALLELPKERLFVVPGNHDIDRSQAKAFPFPTKAEEVTQVLSDVRQYPALMLRFRGFKWFLEKCLAREFCPGGKPFGAHRFTTSDGLTAGVLELNSAWNAVRDQVQGSLIIGERAVWEGIDELERLGGAEVTVALVHHPLDWLTWWDRDQVSALLEEKVDVLLHGHLHSTRIENVTTQFGNLVCLAAGAAYQTRDWTNHVVLGRLDLNARTISTTQLRFEDRGSGWWAVEWPPPARHGAIPWRVNPPAQRCTILIQQGLWEINSETVLSTLDTMVPARPPAKIGFPNPVRDWEAAKEAQEAWYRSVLRGCTEAPHFVVFSSAPIPLAIHLGYLITDRYPVTFYQWDRDRHTWRWLNSVPEDWEVLVDGLPTEAQPASGSVAIRVSVSAIVSEEDVLAVVPDPLAHIHIRVPRPDVTAITSEDQVRILGGRFRDVLSRIRHLIPNCQELHLFCAVPTAVAVNLGRQISETMDPPVHLYQYNRRQRPAYTRVITLG